MDDVAGHPNATLLNRSQAANTTAAKTTMEEEEEERELE